MSGESADDKLGVICIECICSRRWWVRATEIRFPTPRELAGRLRCRGCGSREVSAQSVDSAGLDAAAPREAELFAAIEVWTRDDTRVEQVMARVANLGVGLAAYREALIQRPRSLVIYRHGVHVIRRSDKDPDQPT